ncbi:MAG: hypothetical protein AAGA18_07865 [Verrucomicrobiota bacterium]
MRKSLSDKEKRVAEDLLIKPSERSSSKLARVKLLGAQSTHPDAAETWVSNNDISGRLYVLWNQDLEEIFKSQLYHSDWSYA